MVLVYARNHAAVERQGRWASEAAAKSRSKSMDLAERFAAAVVVEGLGYALAAGAFAFGRRDEMRALAARATSTLPSRRASSGLATQPGAVRGHDDHAADERLDLAEQRFDLGSADDGGQLERDGPVGVTSDELFALGVARRSAGDRGDDG